METAAASLGLVAEGVFASDIDKRCRAAYEGNFHEEPVGDITTVAATDVPDHDVLLAGFPCQPFSIIGSRKGFEDTRGTLFFDIARILKAKRPPAFVLENVKLLARHNKGQTLEIILETLGDDLGYQTDYRILNALDFGLPQKRERIFLVGFREPTKFEWPKGNIPMTPLRDILEKEISSKHVASEHIQKARHARLQPDFGLEPMIWHENKSGHVKARPYCCALRADASYNYLLVDGVRRLTTREMLRLQGFPDSFKQISSDHQTRKQAGNSLPVPVAQAILTEVLKALK